MTDEKKPFTRWGVMSTVSHSGCSPMRGHTVPRTSLLTLKTGTHLYPQRKYSYGIFSGMLQSKSYDFALGLMCRAVEGAHKERVWMAYLKILDADLSRQESFILGKNYLAPLIRSAVHQPPAGAVCCCVCCELTKLITAELYIQPDNIRFFTYSNAVLGYGGLSLGITESNREVDQQSLSNGTLCPHMMLT